MRTRYCTEADRQHEAEIGQRIQGVLPEGFRVYLNSDPHGLDLFIEDEDGYVVAEIEVKRRGHSFGKHPDLTISAAKIAKMKRAGVPAFLFINYDNGLYWTNVTNSNYPTAMGGRTRDQRDEWDVELMAHIPLDAFRMFDYAAGSLLTTQ